MRVLVVEDEMRLAENIATGLREGTGYAVDVVHDGQDAIQLCWTSIYDLVVLDLMLPEMDGTELLRTLRKTNSEIPVLVLTARSGVPDKISNFESGADDYLTKPCAPAELLVRVKALLRRGPVNHASRIRIDDLELDRLLQQVTRAGRKIDLTSKEFALLEYLMSNTGTVISRKMLLENVWGQSFECITNIVPVYILHLRAKIDDPFEHKLIRTVRGVGYTLTDSPEL